MYQRTNLIAGSMMLSLIVSGSAAAEPLRLGLSTWVGYGPLYIAEEKGFFKEEGVEVELIKLGDLEGERSSTGVKSRAFATCSLSTTLKAAMASSRTVRSRMWPA